MPEIFPGPVAAPAMIGAGWLCSDANPLHACSRRSFYVRLEEFLRTRRTQIRFRDQGRLHYDFGRHLLALRGGECRLDAIITHAKRVLDDQPGNHIVLQEFDELFVRSKTADVDLV